MKTDRKILLTIVDKNSIQKEIPIKEAENLFKIQWIEWDKNYLSILDHLKVCYMGKGLGWGLFCKKRIEKNTVIGIFTGNVYYQKRTDSIASEHVFLKDYKDNQFQIVDAARAGNITRFLQHLPSDEVLEKIEIDNSIKNQVATENVKKELIKVDDIYTERYITTKVIEEDVIIGCCYDSQFWLEKEALLFDEKGLILPKHKYIYPLENIQAQNERRMYLSESQHSSLCFFSTPKFQYKAFSLSIIFLLYLVYEYGGFVSIFKCFLSENKAFDLDSPNLPINPKI